MKTPFCALVRHEKIAPLDLSLRQLAVMEAVYGSRPHATVPRLGVREIAKALAVQKPVVTRALDRLSLHGLLQRATDPEDRRLVVVMPTDEGRAVARAINGALAGCT